MRKTLTKLNSKQRLYWGCSVVNTHFSELAEKVQIAPATLSSWHSHFKNSRYLSKSPSDQERMLEGKEGNLRLAAGSWSTHDRVRLAQKKSNLWTQRSASHSFPKMSVRFQSCGHVNGRCQMTDRLRNHDGYQMNRKHIRRLMPFMGIKALFSGPNLSQRCHAIKISQNKQFAVK